MQTIDHDPNEKLRRVAIAESALTIICNLIAAAILIPIGWYLKAHYAEQLGHPTLKFFGYY